MLCWPAASFYFLEHFQLPTFSKVNPGAQMKFKKSLLWCGFNHMTTGLVGPPPHNHGPSLSVLSLGTISTSHFIVLFHCAKQHNSIWNYPKQVKCAVHNTSWDFPMLKQNIFQQHSNSRSEIYCCGAFLIKQLPTLCVVIFMYLYPIESKCLSKPSVICSTFRWHLNHLLQAQKTVSKSSCCQVILVSLKKTVGTF